MKPSGDRIYVSHIEHINAALTAAGRLGVTPTLQNHPSLLELSGTPFLAALAETASKNKTAHIFVADAGDNSGYAISLIRLGFRHIQFSGNKEVCKKIAAIAEEHGAEITSSPEHTIDLSAEKNPLQACMGWLAMSKQSG